MASYNILSLDGGGIRGLVTAVWLHRLERALGRPLHEFFQLVAGTSTGAILACAIGAGIETERIVKLYREQGSTIFPSAPSRLWNRLQRTFAEGFSAPKYSGKPLEEQLQNVFGNLRFNDLAVQTLITSYNTLTREGIVFKNRRPEYGDLAVWELCRASSAAPTYFPAHVMRIGLAEAPLIDGGVVANNPTACAIAEGCRIQRARPFDQQIAMDSFLVASFGTGSSTRPIAAQEARTWGALEWAIPIIDVLFDGAADAVDYVSAQLIPEGRYFRFQTRLETAYDDMDNATATNLNALVSTAERFLETGEGQKKLEGLAAALRASRG